MATVVVAGTAVVDTAAVMAAVGITAAEDFMEGAAIAVAART